jgi:hypothetical protein
MFQKPIMKNFFYVLLLSLVITSCDKKRCEKATVQSDCTGYYIRLEEKDYKVSNKDIMAAFNNGDEVNVTFKKLDNYKGNPNEITCMLYHEFEYWIVVEKIK